MPPNTTKVGGRRPALTEEKFNQIKERLKTSTPSRLAASGYCSSATAYRVFNANNYREYRQRMFEQNKLSNLQYKRHDIPMLGDFKVIKSEVPTQINIDTTSGANLDPTPTHMDQTVNHQHDPQSADEIRMYNNSLSVARNGIDAYRYVDENQLYPGTRVPQRFGYKTIEALCSLARNGATNTDMSRFLESTGYGFRYIDRIACTLAYDQAGLEKFKEAYKSGKAQRELNSRLARARGAKNGGKKRHDNYVQRMLAAGVPENEIRGYKPSRRGKRIKVDITPVEQQPMPVEEPKQEVVTMQYEEPKTVVAETVLSRLAKKVKKMLYVDFLFILGLQVATLLLKLIGRTDLSWVETFAPAMALVAVYAIILSVVGIASLSEQDKE